jgi:hypothetical protein
MLEIVLDLMQSIKEIIELLILIIILLQMIYILIEIIIIISMEEETLRKIIMGIFKKIIVFLVIEMIISFYIKDFLFIVNSFFVVYKIYIL